MKSHIIILVLIVLMSSCQRRKPLNMNIQFREDVSELLEKYVKDHPKYNTLILIKSPEKTFSGERMHGFLLGPLYNGSDQFAKEQSLYFNIDHCRIYVHTDINNLLTSSNKSAYKNTNPPDSFELCPGGGWIMKGGTALFWHNAIFFDFKNGKINRIINRPDTFYMPRNRAIIRNGALVILKCK